MKQKLVCAALVLWTTALGAQTPPPPPPAPSAAPAPPKKPKKKKKKPKSKRTLEPAPPEPTTPGPSAPLGPSIPVPEVAGAPPPPAPAAPAPAPPPPPPPVEQTPVVTPDVSRSVEPDRAEKRFDPTKGVPPPDIEPNTFSFRFEPSWAYRRFLDTEASSTDKRFGTPGVLVLGARAELYPFGPSSGFMQDFGLTGSFFRAVGLALKDFDKNTSVDASWYGFSAGMRIRVLGARGGPFAIGLTAAYEKWAFTFDPGIPPVRLVPNANYDLAEAGFDVRPSFGKFSMFLEASYLFPLIVADLGDRTPGKRGYGGRGVVGVAYRVARSFELDAHATYTFVRLSLAPLPGRADEPGRVFDQYLAATLGTRLMF